MESIRRILRAPDTWAGDFTVHRTANLVTGRLVMDSRVTDSLATDNPVSDSLECPATDSSLATDIHPAMDNHLDILGPRCRRPIPLRFRVN